MGVTANYWRISRVDVDTLKSRGIITLSLWVSKETSESGKLPLYSITKEYSFSQLADAMGSTPDTLKAVCYGLVTAPEYVEDDEGEEVQVNEWHNSKVG